MRFLLVILLGYTSAVTAAADDYLLDLPIIDTVMGGRRTNVIVNTILYPGLRMGSAVSCHPYNPTDVLGENAPSYASHPLIINYDTVLHNDSLQLPDFIMDRTVNAPFFLNVQSNPWNGTQILLRPHPYLPFFNTMGLNYNQVLAQVYREDGAIMLNGTGDVCLHDQIASPNNFPIVGINCANNESFYSIVTHSDKSVVTQHILLTVPTCERFQEFLCTPGNRSPSFFIDMLGDNYVSFLEEHGVL